ncbi:hypothetical protein O3M35_003749 [Rhynocoris fuscipes]|uniref:Solute carrier family 46 member 3 n=1 Tax=Rhynocoris fuscipes TaxID=488301 RepID=A0AAW1CGC9_9HEMI
MENDNEIKSEFKNLKFKEKIEFIFEKITVEPIITCYILPNVLASLTTQNLNLEKACRVNLGYEDWICDAISIRNTSNLTETVQEVQKLVVSMSYWQSILKSALPALLILFLGSFSDRTGRRKPFMLLPMSGELFTSIGLIFCTYFYLEWPMEVAGVIEAIFPAITGGSSTMFMGAFSYMADITSVETRTLRMGIVSVFVSLAAPLGTILSGILYQAIGFYGVFSTVAILYIAGITYGIIRLKEAKPATILSAAFIKELFSITHLSDTFKVAFKSRQGNLRLRILLVMCLSITLFGPIYGEMAVGYLFTIYRFQWDEVNFSLYSTYGIIINLIGTSLGIGLFTHVLKMEDAMLGAIAATSKIIAGICYAFASTPLIFYIVTLVDMIGGTGVIAMRSIASKLVPSEELGKINSLFGVCEAVVPIIYQTLYSFVYNRTINTVPGAFFLVGSFLTVPTLLVFM